MSTRRMLVLILAFGILALLPRTAATAADLRIFASRAVATVLEKIGPQFEKNTGNKLHVTMGLSSEFAERINANEAFDVIAVPPPVLDNLIKSGKVVADSKTLLLRSANGVLVRAGAPKPDVSTVEAFKRALLEAKSVTYLPVPGVPQLLERLGIKDAIAAKATIPKSDTSAEMVAKGEVELAILPSLRAIRCRGWRLPDLCLRKFSTLRCTVVRSVQARRRPRPPVRCSTSSKVRRPSR
jgi:molybdate transport system substrate-binding protein